ncbi:transmembrane anchor protein, partial [Rhizobium phaseoli]
MFNSRMPAPEDLPSSKQLVRSTIIAAAAAAAILVTVVLPSEYAIDPTGVGSALGLTAMGEIKTQLAEEAEMDRVNATVPARPATGQEDSSLTDWIVRQFGIASS